MRRHEVHVLTATDGRTFAACQTCHRKSKQGTKKSAEAWQVQHLIEATKEQP